jgi:hypothetical protein
MSHKKVKRKEMTQQGHTLLALVISFILYQLAWHLILKHNDVTKKNMLELEGIFKDLFFR